MKYCSRCGKQRGWFRTKIGGFCSLCGQGTHDWFHRSTTRKYGPGPKSLGQKARLEQKLCRAWEIYGDRVDYRRLVPRNFRGEIKSILSTDEGQAAVADAMVEPIRAAIERRSK